MGADNLAQISRWWRWTEVFDAARVAVFDRSPYSYKALAGGAAARVYGPGWLRRPVAVYVEAIRNTPLIVQLFLIFFGLPSAGINFDAATAAMLALSINLGAYSIEIIRAGLEAIPRSQIEAGQSLGMSGPQIFRYVIIFPALKLT
ncbi:MAG: ABC transporter permease subunit, partial [Deltaproteobacteria bacterium]